MDPIPKKIPKSVYGRYVLMNLLGMVGVVLVLIVIKGFFYLPDWFFWTIIVFWIVKDVALFPFVWRSYLPNELSMTGSMVGRRAIVAKRLDPSGYVEVCGELWRAEQSGNKPPLEEGRPVRVQKMEGLTLFVEPMDTEKEE